MNVYRVEKDGVTFHIRPEMIGYYASEGYAIYKTYEEEVVDVEAEVSNLEEPVGTAAIGGHDANQV